MPIYTKTGDSGTAGLFSGERQKKDASIFVALGDLDMLECDIGIASNFASAFENEFSLIQRSLKNIASLLCSGNRQIQVEREVLEALSTKTTFFENEIDRIESLLPELKEFVLFFGGAAYVHKARAQCRAAERSVVSLTTKHEILKFINRLSDYLFMVARLVAFEAFENEQTHKMKRDLL